MKRYIGITAGAACLATGWVIGTIITNPPTEQTPAPVAAPTAETPCHDRTVPDNDALRGLWPAQSPCALSRLAATLPEEQGKWVADAAARVDSAQQLMVLMTVDPTMTPDSIHAAALTVRISLDQELMADGARMLGVPATPGNGFPENPAYRVGEAAGAAASNR